MTDGNVGAEFKIVEAVESDVPQILAFIKGIAEFEKLLHAVEATEETLAESLFGETRYAEVLLAYEGEIAVGYALYFFNFSTFMGRQGLYLEDLYILPEKRSAGYGRKLLRKLARIAIEKNCGRMEWSVIDWNTRAFDFYESIGAKAESEWVLHRMTTDAINKLATEEDIEPYNLTI